MNRIDLENHIDDAYKVYAEHQTELLRDSFNSLQMMYKEMFKVWYCPAQAVIVEQQSLWDMAEPLPDIYCEAYNHE